MSNQDLVAQFLQTRRVERVPVGRRRYSKRAIQAIAEGPDFKLAALRQDQALGYVNEFGRKIRGRKS